MKNRVVVILSFIALFLSIPAFAQFSGETELGSDGKGGSFASQYVFYDFNHANVLTRYFWVNGVLQRGEFSIGPTFHLKKSGTVKLEFGGTTDREIQLAGTVLTKVGSHDLIYIADGKLSTTAGHASTLYEKLFFAIDKKGVWQVRIEDLQVGPAQGFLRLEVERQIQMKNSHFYAAPFYDPIVRMVGGQIGFRFFNLGPKPH